MKLHFYFYSNINTDTTVYIKALCSKKENEKTIVNMLRIIYLFGMKFQWKTFLGSLKYENILLINLCLVQTFIKHFLHPFRNIRTKQIFKFNEKIAHETKMLNIFC